jgi:hypothetical protein
MIPANYQHIKDKDFKVVYSEDNKVAVKIVAGELENEKGLIKTQTSVNVFVIDIEESGSYDVKVPKTHQSMLYLISGDILVNDSETLKLDKTQLIEFNQDGDGFSIKGNKPSKLLFLSGEPFNEKVTSYGPYVMNTQTEILEAMRDYQMGKMGFLSVN